MHGLLVTAIASGAILIAGIGFAGSYTAVRDLAADKGFGGFANLFPIGIDAGICVLLALDLLLTHHRIPLPLLRHTAWLLTAATIAFNAASAWPDPLATGMHAVTPLLFITTVEAARHATGRIAHITAGTHMDSIRLARWLLAPAATFLLWRRMKLWEQRSYTQALTLEQQRLLYQARLRSRYGRTWRHKAPTEALIPLRLTRHGIPLPHTTPSAPPTPGRINPAAAQPAPSQAAAADGPRQQTNDGHAHTQPETTNRATSSPQATRTGPSSASAEGIGQGSGPRQLHTPHQAFSNASRTPTTPTHWAWWEPAHSHTRIPEPHDPFNHRARPATEVTHENTALNTQQTDTPASAPAPRRETRLEKDPDLSDASPARHRRTEESALPSTSGPAALHAEADATATPEDHQRLGSGPDKPIATHSTRSHPTPHPHTASPARRTGANHESRPPTPVEPSPIHYAHVAPEAPDDPPPRGQVNDLTHPPPTNSQPTLTDRYYLEWMNYQTQHGTEPTPDQLSTHLAAQGLLGRGGNPVSPSNLRRHFLNWRIYNLWAARRTHHDTPSAADIAHQCAIHHITGQYNRPITPTYITQHTPEFQRRWHTLTHQSSRTP
ncbi:DUF2637 domain-containing protein [Streptomyces justiciae]|uniref:DUF2637 domain-containing protein n=1 Tax=Streptomyces justiciae TaxID=2780140 RepID=UPI002244AC23|nr:DUF2637 domain-containing protein [Streptomyces justiciae]MCW8384528.1 DUF2637 domain-containing protein [Streptomyces justiciae]